MIKYFSLILILGVSGHANPFGSLGGYGGVMDRMGAGVRELGSGNTGTASILAMPAPYWNPAALAFSSHLLSGFGSDVRLLNRNGGYAAIQGRVAPNMGLGLGLINRGDYNVSVRDKDENMLGTARPQALGSYLGMGVKTSRKNAFGVTLQWYNSTLDLDGSGDINTIGMFNLGWLRIWGKSLQTAIVARNLGMNPDLSARFDLVTLQASNEADLNRSGKDFFPKTLVLAAAWSFRLYARDMNVFFELLDFQLEDKFLEFDGERHAVDVRLGADWKILPFTTVRSGYDRGNYTCGFGYEWKLGPRVLEFNYALVVEKNVYLINPFAVDFRYKL